MSYEVLILRSAQKQLATLPKADYERVRDAVAGLAENPRPIGCKKLVGAKVGAFVTEIIGPSMRLMMLSQRSRFYTSEIDEISIHRESYLASET